MLSITRLLPRSALTLRRFSTALPSEALDGEKNIHSKLSAKFSPTQLEVQDVSGGCGTFYAITIASTAFSGLSMVKQHKLVTETLKQEIEGIHGLQIKTMTPTS